MPGARDTSTTLSSSSESRELSERPSSPHLYLVLESHRPLAPPARMSLHGFDEVVVGRGRPRAFLRRDEGARRILEVRSEDQRMSSRHAVLRRSTRQWELEDLGSRNGCIVNGVQRTRAELVDGDVIEIGYTFFIYREAVSLEEGEPSLLDGASLPPSVPGLSTMVPALGRIFARLSLIAQSTVPVLVEGENGTGKELLARAIHELSGRTGEFVPVNSAALPRELIEDELFGHSKGAFTSAVADTPGLVRASDRGTLFLDEIGDMPAQAQAVLLRVLQEREVRPVGATRALRVDLRVVAATHQPLDRMVEDGRFRADLLNRLTGHRVELPPLRARREDLGLLLAALLRRADPELAGELRIRPRAVRALLQHRWPGNVRELDKAVSSAILLARAEREIGLDHLPSKLQEALGGAAAARSSEDDARRDTLLGLLRQHEGNIAAVARAMGKERMQIHRWLKRYGIDPDSFRASEDR
ncbi:Fis family transcriptional regulator [Sorangium cellulosum]|uniref:Fis family transcriptional regulator n=1 Tax=Sorangium cellulosum TaxID=56 RepID=A0A150SCV7_SORCE|nr:Fis family transcriptional regulator [Sorangium cellulosum]KYF90323.1 Fis family transcriptional regulator [Sorangium cellulosum]